MQSSLHTTYAARTVRRSIYPGEQPGCATNCYDPLHTAPADYPMHTQQDIVAEIPRLRRYARALTGDSFRADDLVQDCIERALSRWPLWRPGNLRAWLFTIMHNVFVNQLRTAGRLDYRADEDLPESPTRAEQEDGLMLRDLDRALQQLPLEQREALLLVTLEELTYDEAARVLDVPVGTIMSRLFRAREKLRGILQHDAGVSRLRVVK